MWLEKHLEFEKIELEYDALSGYDWRSEYLLRIKSSNKIAGVPLSSRLNS